MASAEGGPIQVQLDRFELDHDLLRIGINQCDRLIKRPERGLGSLKQLAQDVCHRLTLHLDAEERFFEETLTDKSFQSTLFLTMARDTRKQIRKITRLVASFPWQPEPAKAATVLDVVIRLVRQHVEQCDQQMFPHIVQLHHLPYREPKKLAA